jgi:hypothetical protein
MAWIKLGPAQGNVYWNDVTGESRANLPAGESVSTIAKPTNGDPNDMLKWATANVDSDPEAAAYAKDYYGKTLLPGKATLEQFLAGPQSMGLKDWGPLTGVQSGGMGLMSFLKDAMTSPAGLAMLAAFTAGGLGIGGAGANAGAAGAMDAAGNFIPGATSAGLGTGGGFTAGAGLPTIEAGGGGDWFNLSDYGVDNFGGFDSYDSLANPGSTTGTTLADVAKIPTPSIGGGTPGVGDAGAFDQFGSRAVPSDPYSSIIGVSGAAATGLPDWLKPFFPAGTDPSKLFGTALQLGTGLAGANAQRSATNTLADRLSAFGAPSRARYESSFSPDFKITDMPGFQQALDAENDSLLRKASVNGNPFGNPGVLAEINKYVTGNLALPALQNYRNQNASTGGYGAFSTAAPQAMTTAAATGAAPYNVLGATAENLFNPQNSLADQLAKLTGTPGSGNNNWLSGMGKIWSTS